MPRTPLEGALGEDGGVQGSLTALAAGQRFSSPAARAAFCIVMGASDYLDAAERLQRAGLKVRDSQDETQCCLTSCCA